MHLFKFEIEVRDLRDDRCVVQVFDVGTNKPSAILSESGEWHPNPFTPQSGSIAFWSIIPTHSIRVMTPFGAAFFSAALAGRVYEVEIDRSALPTDHQKLFIVLPKGTRKLDVYILHADGLPEVDPVERMRGICRNAKSSDVVERSDGGPRKSPPPSTSTSQ